MHPAQLLRFPCPGAQDGNEFVDPLENCLGGQRWRGGRGRGNSHGTTPSSYWVYSRADGAADRAVRLVDEYVGAGADFGEACAVLEQQSLPAVLGGADERAVVRVGEPPGPFPGDAVDEDRVDVRGGGEVDHGPDK